MDAEYQKAIAKIQKAAANASKKKNRTSCLKAFRILRDRRLPEDSSFVDDLLEILANCKASKKGDEKDVVTVIHSFLAKLCDQRSLTKDSVMVCR